MVECYPRRGRRTVTGSPRGGSAVLEEQDLGEHPSDHDTGGDACGERELEPSADRPAQPGAEGAAEDDLEARGAADVGVAKVGVTLGIGHVRRLPISSCPNR